MKKGMTKEAYKKLRYAIDQQGEPMMKYTGYRLAKSGASYKSLNRITVYQCNLQITQRGEKDGMDSSR